MEPRPIGEKAATGDVVFTWHDAVWLAAMTIAIVALYRFLWPALTGDMKLYLVF